MSNKIEIIKCIDAWAKTAGLPTYSELHQTVIDLRISDVEGKLQKFHANKTGYNEKLYGARYHYLRDILARKELRPDIGNLRGVKAIFQQIQMFGVAPIDIIRIELPMYHSVANGSESYIWDQNESFDVGTNMDMAIDSATLNL